ncbi:hypothetical protein [Absidia glauca]|uniref:Uncharacterized protein n=1 Tax=Absidia glauca TaxID=4829 RepID=A0A168LAK4_ABSGL|nr:hypothetical protein [Absidia glauca]
MFQTPTGQAGFQTREYGQRAFLALFSLFFQSFLLETNLITMTPQETFDKGMVFKAEGNEAFKNQNYKEALGKYYNAILHLKTVGGNKNKEQFDAKSNEQLALIYNNMAAVSIKQENWPRATENCKKSLELNSNNMKAKFRLAQSYIRQKDLDKAEPLLTEVLKANPDGNNACLDSAVKQEMALFKKQTKSMDGKEKLIYQKMMSKMNQQ